MQNFDEMGANIPFSDERKRFNIGKINLEYVKCQILEYLNDYVRSQFC